MKKVLSLLLIATFLVSFAGCAPKSEYERLLAEKSLIEKKNAALTVNKANLEGKISSHVKEIRTLRTSLRTAETKANSLQKELDKANAQIKSLKR